MLLLTIINMAEGLRSALDLLEQILKENTGGDFTQQMKNLSEANDREEERARLIEEVEQALQFIAEDNIAHNASNCQKFCEALVAAGFTLSDDFPDYSREAMIQEAQRIIQSLRVPYEIGGQEVVQATQEKVQKAAPEALPELVIPEGYEHLAQIMGGRITDLKVWKEKNAPRLFEVSNGRIVVEGFPDLPEKMLDPVLLEGRHLVDPKQPFTHMGVSIIPRITVDGEAFEAKHIKTVFDILGLESSFPESHFAKIENFPTCPIESGVYVFSLEAVPGTSTDEDGTDTFEKMQARLEKLDPEMKNSQDREFPFVFALFDFVLRYGVSKYKQKGYFVDKGHLSHSKAPEYAVLREMGSDYDGTPDYAMVGMSPVEERMSFYCFGVDYKKTGRAYIKRMRD